MSPRRGSLFRLAYRHFLRDRGFSREQAKTIADSVKASRVKEAFDKCGPILLGILTSLYHDVTEKPIFNVEAPDTTHWAGINISNWELPDEDSPRVA